MKRFIFVFTALLLQTKVWANSFSDQENLGQFRFSEFSLMPQLHLAETDAVDKNGFELKTSWLGFEWRKDETLRGQLWLGTTDLIGQPIWMTPKTTPDLGIVEAYIEGKSFYGDMRAGLLNVGQGFEGVFPEWSRMLPETRVRQKGWLVRRDYGLQLRWSFGDYKTAMTVHNGESGANTDGRFWYSGSWLYQNSEGTGFLMTGSVGSTKTESTSGSLAGNVNNQFIFLNTDTAKLRSGTIALFREDQGNLFLLEYGHGEILQNEAKNSYSWGHFDLSWSVGGDLNLLMRYEQSQPNMNNSATVVKSSSIGFAMWSKDRLQSLSLYGTQNEEQAKTHNNELFLVFRLNSRPSN